MTKKIKESTTAGSVGTVSTPLGNVQKRAGSLFKGKKTKKKFYEAPQFTSKQQVIDYFVSRGKTAKQGAAAWERGYRGTKKSTPPSHWLDRAEKAQQDREDQKSVSEQANKKVPRVYQPFVPAVGKRLKFYDPNTGLLMSSVTVTNIDNDLIYFQDDETGFEYQVNKKDFDPQTLHEREINEQDLIIVPGQGRKLKPGFIPKDKDRTDHEVEMALSDLYQAAKNAKTLYDMVKGISEEQGLEGWVQEKIIKANDYLNTVREYMEHQTQMHEASLKQTLKTTARKLNPAIKGELLNKGYDELEYGRDIIRSNPDDLSPEGKKIADRSMKHGKRLMRLAKDENPFTGQPKLDEMTGGVLAGGMSNFEEGVAEGLADASVQDAIIDTVERLFHKNNLSDYGALEAIRQGVKHHFSKPGATAESAIEGILNILDKRMRKSGDFLDLGRFKEALRQGVAHQLKKQGVAEDNDTIYKNWRNDLGRDYDTTLKLVDKDYNPNKPRNVADELAKMNKKLKSVEEGENNPLGRQLEKLTGMSDRELDRMYEKINLISQKYKDDPEMQKALQTLKNEIEKFIAKRADQNPIDITTEGKKDACYSKVKSRYKVWPSAYASGALVKCRKVGASNWGNKSKK